MIGDLTTPTHPIIVFFSYSKDNFETRCDWIGVSGCVRFESTSGNRNSVTSHPPTNQVLYFASQARLGVSLVSLSRSQGQSGARFRHKIPFLIGY